jgi:DNA-directed RNA polymerase subunit M/transcription elongation factor TFIIS
MSRPPNTEEVMREDDDSSIPYDPNLVCSKCGKQYRIGQIQYFRRHLEGLCHPDTEDVIAKGNLTEEIAFYAEEVRRMSRQPNTEEVMREDDDSSLPYDPNLVCPKCGKIPYDPNLVCPKCGYIAKDRYSTLDVI